MIPPILRAGIFSALLITLGAGQALASCMDSVSPKQSEQYAELIDSMMEHTQLSPERVDEILLQLHSDVEAGRERFQHAFAFYHKKFIESAQRYMRSAQEAAGYWDLMRGRLRDRAPWNDPNAKTAAEVDRDESYNLMVQIIHALESLGLSRSDLLPYYDSLRIALQSTDYKTGVDQINSALHFLETAPVTVPLILAFPALGKGFLFALGASIGKTLLTTGEKNVGESRGEILCELVKSSYGSLPHEALASILASPLGLIPARYVPWKIIVPASAGAGAVVLDKKWHERQAEIRQGKAMDQAADLIVQAVQPPNENERIEQIKREYLAQTGKELSDDQAEALKRLLSK